MKKSASFLVPPLKKGVPRPSEAGDLRGIDLWGIVAKFHFKCYLSPLKIGT